MKINSTTFSLNDGVHVNAPWGYGAWVAKIYPVMQQYKMDTDKRLDLLGPPGLENISRPGCDDLCLIALCYYFKICKK